MGATGGVGKCPALLWQTAPAREDATGRCVHAFIISLQQLIDIDFSVLACLSHLLILRLPLVFDLEELELLLHAQNIFDNLVLFLILLLLDQCIVLLHKLVKLLLLPRLCLHQEILQFPFLLLLQLLFHLHQVCVVLLLLQPLLLYLHLVLLEQQLLLVLYVLVLGFHLIMVVPREAPLLILV